MNRFVPTEEQRRNVEAMTGFGIPQEPICLLIHNPETGRPIDIATLDFTSGASSTLAKSSPSPGRSVHL
jgi:hypothetical protein